jgi:methylenetetrahydrofolate dehydrogenase (NADP+)/methenyltetrahydrofolate cyclohydrolase
VLGKHVVIVGRSDIVGKPLAAMLVQRTSELGPEAVNASVTVCHSQTQNLSDLTQRADILVAALGKPKFITRAMVRAGSVVVDVGINRTPAGIVGDVDFESVRDVVAAITPVPGGVGPLTVAMLLRNTLRAAEGQLFP